MPVVLFASNKGGVAKTTGAILAGTELDRRGVPVTYMDLDRSNYSLTRWRQRRELPETIKFVDGVGESNIVDAIEEHDKDGCLLFVDLEGLVSRLTHRAISQADLVIIPMATSVDALVGKDILKLIAEEEQKTRRKIKHSVLLTRTNAAFMNKEERRIRSSLQNHVHILEATLATRAAFQSLFFYGGSLYDMDEKQDSNLPQAIENAAGFTDAILKRLKD